MRRGWLVVLAIVLVGGGLALVLATDVFGGDRDTSDTSIGAVDGTTIPPSTVPLTTVTSPTPTSLSVTTVGDDPLCVAYHSYQQAIDGHLPVTDAEDLEIFLTASLEFYGEAVGLVEPPEQEAFAEFLAYQQAQHNFSESHDWSPSPPLEELLENPPPTAPAAATETVATVLENRCGVEVVRE